MNKTIMTTLASLLALCAACSSTDNDGKNGSRYALGAVVIDAEGNRTTYVQTVDSLSGPFDNKTAIELPGNGVLMAGNGSFYVGLAEEPTWVRYAPDATGKIVKQGSISFLDVGADAMDYGNVIVDAQTAVSVFTKAGVAVVWNPSTLKITGEIDLSSLLREGYEFEAWTTSTHDGLVYVPVRWSDWEGGRIYPGVATAILDPKKLELVATATDDRCASGGRVVFDKDGYGYVMGDGRNYSIQMFANAAGTTAPANCLLRIAPGKTEFEADYYYKISELTGGLESIDELQVAADDTGVGFSKMFYPDKLPPGVEPVDFGFWSESAHKMWRLKLGDTPVAEEVAGLPFSAIGFSGSPLDGKLYTGESVDQGQTSDVYETDPSTNAAKLVFKMDGYFNGLYDLSK